MTHAYKFQASDLDKNIAVAVPNNTNVLQTLVNRTCKLLQANPKAYLRFGVYWFALKKVLNEHSPYDWGSYSVKYLEEEYSTAADLDNKLIPATPEQIIIAAHTFSDVTDNAFNPKEEWDIDGFNWNVKDEDFQMVN